MFPYGKWYMESTKGYTLFYDVSFECGVVNAV